MDYKLIHDRIISRALNRDMDQHTESHHITPICEGGFISDLTVKLTQKEHRLVHLLRYKMTGVVGNIYAYNMLKSGNRYNNCVIAGMISHKILKEECPKKYREKQRKAGINGGKNVFENKKGIHSDKFSPDEKQIWRDKGRATTIRNKLGMFSDDFREKHKKTLMKKVLTPDQMFDSMGQAANYYGVSNATITYRIKSNSQKFKNWQFAEVK